MGPIWFYFLTLVLLWGAIGVIRGFKKELGVTIILLVMMLLVYLIQLRVVPRFFETWPETRPALLLTLYQVLMLFGAFIAYQGYTLSFPGANPPGTWGWIYGLIVGLLNGYLLWGTIWYYTARLGYPLSLFSLPVSPLDQQLVAYLPLSLLDQAGLSSEQVLYVLIFTLLALLIVRVIR